MTFRPEKWAPLCALLALTPACKHTGDYVWVDDLPQAQQAADKEYIIQSGDTISVRVWNQEGMSAKARVRQDGKISLPFLNDVEAAGIPPNVLARRLQARLKDFIVNPVVTISLEEPKPIQISVLGEVTKPGNVQLEPGAGVIQALGAAGGLNDFASRDMIFVIRQTQPDAGAPLRIRFTYESLTQVRGRAATFRLQSGDVVVVE
ncbi:MAG TPA: polysaccharide biosynthesis/export family protein [Anaeromyxobacteraceae bacterium]|nr:polysaccharide biosynthesis/export family protein [Anaeromyxobacteraceae bacterium]